MKLHTIAASVVLAGAVPALALSLAAQGSGERTKVLGILDPSKAALAKQMAGAVGRGDTPGVAELVVNRDGILFEGASGHADIATKVPMRNNAIFNIASMTKPVTSVAIMMLMEQGKLKLDDPVSKYLGADYEHQQVISKFNDKDATYETRPAKRPMTIRHLLSHTSGIGYTTWSATALAIQEKTKKNEWEQPLLSDPGDVWHYSTSTRVLGFVVEKVTNTTLEAWYQQHIFKPLGMADTSYAVAADKQSRVATQYQRGDGGKLEELPKAPVASMPTPPFRGDGGLYSTVEDYSRFVRMLLNGGTLGSVRILSEPSVKMMGENQIGSIFVETQPAAVPARTRPMPLGAGKDKFGLGFQIASGDPAMSKFRSPGSMSWAGLFNTEFWIDPVKHIGGIQMMQVLPFYDDGAIRTLRGFEETVYRELK